MKTTGRSKRSTALLRSTGADASVEAVSPAVLATDATFFYELSDEGASVTAQRLDRQTLSAADRAEASQQLDLLLASTEVGNC